jgi:ubiquinone/menaquinone biosynthesis C-methylase UbiE
LLPLYDPIVKLLGGDKARQALLDQANLRPGHRVLEIGAGTGTLVTMAKRLYSNVEVIGLDPDPKALARARRKAARARLSIQFDQGFADQLPYPECSFDRVFSSFMFHHLPEAERGQMLKEVRRVLKPGGEIHMLDFDGPGDSPPGLFARLFHTTERLKGNSERRVIGLMTESGFKDAGKVGRRKLFSGGVAYYRGSA